ncbi:hypothetical protein SSX86_030593 [Deinandra increscens subsp. villosa]|uniref:PHD-type domain-containing protein n=1 Tax=Deinandra increscens subsp. villosa TaxID=3103831 RepID=A0AAP0CBJ7_9ASTR
MPIIKSPSSIAASMEFVKYQPEFNPEAIINYCSNDVLSGRSKNPDVKDLILKVKKHLSSIGWSFFFFHRNPDRRELRYRSPAGRFYYSLRTACQSLLDHQGRSKPQKHEEPEANLGKKDGSLSDNRPKKKIRMEDVENSYYEQCVVDHDPGFVEKERVEEIRVQEPETKTKTEETDDSSSYNRPKKKIRMECIVDHDPGFVKNERFEETKVREPETKTKKEEIDGSSSYNRPKKKIRMEDVENSYFQQQTLLKSVAHSHYRRESVSAAPSSMKSIEKKNDFKPKKLIRKVEGSSTRRRCILSLLIEKNVVSRGSKVSYCKKDGRILAKGRVYDEGIRCDCCDQFFLLSKFEAHAGSTYHRPAANIFLEDGRSIFDCQTQLQQENKVFTTTKSAKSTENVTGNDDFCAFCNDGGELVLCDSCTSSYHATCIGLTGIPNSAYWFCPSCCCRICHEGQNSNFTTEDRKDHACKIKCGQCERQFHIACVTKLGFSVSKTDSNKWLCSESCERISTGLNAISRRPIRLNINNLSWRLLKNRTDDTDTETYSKLNVALDVMHECFQPVKHHGSDNDLVEDLIFSRCSKRSNFSGFFTAVLEKDDEVISVATLRVYGCKVAEIPLVATRFRHRRLGMCRILMDEIGKKLGELGVERLVLPAVPEMVSTWTESFRFSVMTEPEQLNLVEYKFLDFPGTIKCQKFLK